MALPSNPTRGQIWSELADSTYRNGGTNVNSLKNMDAYVFGGDGSGYTRDGFGGYGTPLVSSLTATGGNSQIDLSFTLGNTGGFDCTFIAQYWVDTNDVNPSPYYEETLGSSSTTGTKNYSFSNNVSNGTTYEVRVTAYNKFNNYTTNLPAPRDIGSSWDWTNTTTATPSQPTLSTPTITSSSRVANFDVDAYITLSAGTNQDDFDLECRINSSASNLSRQCSTGLSTTTPEIITQMDQFVQSGDTVEFRARATGTGYTPSAWSNWTTISFGTKPNCPL